MAHEGARLRFSCEFDAVGSDCQVAQVKFSTTAAHFDLVWVEVQHLPT